MEQFKTNSVKLERQDDWDLQANRQRFQADNIGHKLNIQQLRK